MPPVSIKPVFTMFGIRSAGVGGIEIELDNT